MASFCLPKLLFLLLYVSIITLFFSIILPFFFVSPILPFSSFTLIISKFFQIILNAPIMFLGSINVFLFFSWNLVSLSWFNRLQGNARGAFACSWMAIFWMSCFSLEVFTCWYCHTWTFLKVFHWLDYYFLLFESHKSLLLGCPQLISISFINYLKEFVRF